jgi:agmatinase
VDDLKIPKFIGSLNDSASADIILAGFPYDCTSSFRSGSRFASREIRAYSYEAIESFSIYCHKDLGEIRFFDAGDLGMMFGNPADMVKQVKTVASKIMTQNRKLLGIGGEHLVTFPLYLATQEIYGGFTLVQLDAHADLRGEYSGDGLNHACVMKLCLDKGLKKLIQIGIRSCTKEECEIRDNEDRIIPLSSHKDLEDVLDTDEMIYLTVDVDFFDPAFFPGTGTPEAGGASFTDFIEILNLFRKKQIHIIGADIVEFAPDLDHSKISTAMAAKITRELLLVM